MAVHEERIAVPGIVRRRLNPARVWRELQSMTFAIIMLTVILLVIIAGSFLPKDNGVTYVYKSWWFYGLNFILMASVVSCASRRIGSVYRFAFRVPVVHRGSFYRAGDTARSLETTIDPQAAAQAVERALGGRRYRVAIEEHEGAIHILADRFRVFRLGTLVSHFSIVLLVATIVWGALAGWLDQAVLLEAGGASVAVGHDTGLTLRSDSFNFGLYANGNPRNFHDHLTLTDSAGHSYRQVIDVNTPWYFGGMFGYDIHQASYGLTARLVALDARGKVQPYCVIQSGNQGCSSDLPPLLMVPLGDGSYQPAGGGFNAFYFPSQRVAVTLTVHDPVPMARLPQTAVVTALQPPQKAGETMKMLSVAADMPIAAHRFGSRTEMITTQPLTVKGIRLSVLIRRIAGVNIGHNPAVPFIFGAFTLVIIGLVSVLYFPFTRLWVYIVPAGPEQSGSLVLMRGAAEKSRQGFRRRFEVLVGAVQREFGRSRPAAQARPSTL